MRRVIRGFLAVLLAGLSSCGLPSNPVTPPEILVTGESGVSGGVALGTSLPFTGVPVPVSSLAIPPGLSLWGSAAVDNSLVFLVRTTNGQGGFLVAPLPLSGAPAFVQVSFSSGAGTPWALAPVTSQILAVLMKTSSAPQGCIALFDAATLVQMTGGGTLSASQEPPCNALPEGPGSLEGGFLLPLADGVMFLAGTVTPSGSGTNTTTLFLMTQSSVLSGNSITPKSVWTLPVSYGANVPIAGVALPEAVLLPDPSAPAIDLYQVTTLYEGGGGKLQAPLSKTTLDLPAPPTLLAIDPARNFLLSGSGGTLSLFGLGAVLSPGGTLGSIDSFPSLSGETFQTMTIYTGSS